MEEGGHTKVRDLTGLTEKYWKWLRSGAGEKQGHQQTAGVYSASRKIKEAPYVPDDIVILREEE